MIIPLGGGVEGNWITQENTFEDIKVTYKQSSTYTVTIPKTITLGTNKQSSYSVKVSGDIDNNQRVYVAPVDSISDTNNIDFYMKELSSGSKKEDVVATVTQNKYYWNSEDVTNSYEENNNSVSAPDLTAGNWEGTFQVEIRLEAEKENEHNYVDGKCECGEIDPNAPHEHNYIDGKCECGAIDPNHEHNYEDGVCTICGKESDPYETAPTNAYSNWNYTLDNENDIITLNYYKGSETNVIVYGNYVIGGKTYKTQIKSNTSNAAYNTAYMFNGTAIANCKNIKTITFSKSLDTSSVTNTRYMFNDCESLTSLDLSGFDTSNVIDMTYMFSSCYRLASIIFGDNWDTSKVTNMQGMFYNFAAYVDEKVSLDLSMFNTSNVTNMTQMFWCATGLKSIDFSSFDTSKVTTMYQMFGSATSLTSLDLTSFDTSNVTDMQYMFSMSSKLTSILVTSGKWSTSQANTSNMFKSCGTSSVTYK